MTRPALLLPLALAASLLAACSDKDEAPERHIGYVEAEWIYVAAPEAGWVVEETVKEGERVAVGDLLFRLDTTAQEAALAQAQAQVLQSEAQSANLATGARTEEVRALEARLDQAQAQLDQAIADRDRVLPLAEKGYATQAQRDAVVTAVEAAQAAVEGLKRDIDVARLAARPAERAASEAATASAQAVQESAEYRLSQRTVTAGAEGSVEEVFLRTGEYATPGAPVLAILPDNGLKVRFFVGQAELPQLSLGQTVSISADGLAAPVSAPVSYIAQEAEFTPPVIYSKDVRGKLVFMVEADVPAGTGLRAGLPVEVDW